MGWTRASSQIDFHQVLQRDNRNPLHPRLLMEGLRLPRQNPNRDAEVQAELALSISIPPSATNLSCPRAKSRAHALDFGLCGQPSSPVRLLPPEHSFHCHPERAKDLAFCTIKKLSRAKSRGNAFAFGGAGLQACLMTRTRGFRDEGEFC